MEVINELENAGRDAYCGSVFYWNDDGQFDSNILIRTIVHSDNTLFCWGGGGIVHDSTVDEEYHESLIKVANLTGIKS
jgi:para-aminobenzoate synthetase component 1